jgi:hypothetical protein
MSNARPDTKFLCILLHARPLVQISDGGMQIFNFFFKERPICPCLNALPHFFHAVLIAK